MIAHIYPLELHVVSGRGYAGCLEGCFQGYRGEAMHDPGYELRRIPIPGTSVNKGKEKAGDPYFRTPASLPHHLARGKQGLTPSAVKRLLLRVDHPAGCRDCRFLGQRRIQLALACRLEVVTAIVV